MWLRKFLIFSLIAILFLQATPSVFASGYWDTTIDVLVVESEAFTRFADFLNGFYRWLWYWDLGDSFTEFWNTFQIKFEVRGVVKNWHIDTPTDDAYYILQEAISDFHYNSGVTTYNGYVIDLLIVFVDAFECDMIGFSVPEWKALIIGNDAFDAVPMENVFIHELSHQFYATHCDNPTCVMWGDGLMCFKVTWVCQRHYDEINTHKHRFDRWVEVTIRGRGGGGRWCLMM
jgi:hypothetical protein